MVRVPPVIQRNSIRFIVGYLQDDAKNWKIVHLDFDVLADDHHGWRSPVFLE